MKDLFSKYCRDQFPALERQLDGQTVVYLDGPAGTRAPGTSGLGHPTERRPAKVYVFQINSLRTICMDNVEIDYRKIK